MTMEKVIDHDRQRLAAFVARTLCELDAEIEKHATTIISSADGTKSAPFRTMLERRREDMIALAKTWGIDPIDRSLAAGEFAPRVSP